MIVQKKKEVYEVERLYCCSQEMFYYIEGYFENKQYTYKCSKCKKEYICDTQYPLYKREK